MGAGYGMVQQGIFRSPYMLQRAFSGGGSEDPIAALIGNALSTYTGLRQQKQANALAQQKESDERDYRQSELDVQRERNKNELIGHYLGAGFLPSDGSTTTPSATPSPTPSGAPLPDQGPVPAQGPKIVPAVGQRLAQPDPMAPPVGGPSATPTAPSVPPTTPPPTQINIPGVGPMVMGKTKQQQMEDYRRTQQEKEQRTTGTQLIRARLNREPTSDDEALTAGKDPQYVEKLFAGSPQGQAQAATGDSLKTAAAEQARLAVKSSPAALAADSAQGAAQAAGKQGVATSENKRMAEIGANAADVHLDMKRKETDRDWPQTEADVKRVMAAPQLAGGLPHLFGGKASDVVDAAKQLGISGKASAYINDIWQMQDARQLSIGSKSLGRSPELLRQGFREFGQNLGEGPEALAVKQRQRLGVIRMAKASSGPAWNAALQAHNLKDEDVFSTARPYDDLLH